MKYKNKPVVIEAFKLGETLDFPEWWREARNIDKIVIHRGKDGYTWYSIKTAKGIKLANFGKDYIVRDTEGNIFPCPVKIFEQTYEIIE